MNAKRAGAEGIEPSVAVLETAGLPLTDAPIKGFMTLLVCEELAFRKLYKTFSTQF